MDEARDQDRLIDKLRRIEALFAGAKTDGERTAAAGARERIRAKLGELERVDAPIEYRFTLADSWTQMLLVALLRRYGIRPYRYPRQRRTTVMARVSRRFVDEILWPEFLKFQSALESYLRDVTSRVISEAICSDTTDPHPEDGARGPAERQQTLGLESGPADPV